MTSLQKANLEIKDLKMQLNNYKKQIIDITEYYEKELRKKDIEHAKEVMALISSFNEQKSKYEEHEKEMENKCNNLEKENIELKKENDILKGNAIEKNSTNSNKPASKDEKHTIQNHREKSNRKQGGQIGRKGKTLTSEEVEKLIKEEKVEVVEEHYGDETSKKTTVKYIMDVKTKVIVRKIIIHGKLTEEVKKEIPEECKENNSSVVYSNNLKALVAVMYAQEVIAFDRMSEFIQILTENILKVSHGSLVNWVGKVSKKLKNPRKKLASAIRRNNVVYTDLTTTSVNGKYGYVRNYSNENVTVLYATLSKRIQEIRRQNILPNYKGYIMHDHDTGLYNFGIRSKHAECWIHLGRELKYFQKNIKENDWANELWDFALGRYNEKNELLKKNITEFTSKKIIEYENKYDEIVKKGLLQNTQTKSDYLKKKEKPVLNRLVKYKQNYLNFIHDFIVPFDNNPSERAVRPVKNKKKISGCHRSFDGLRDYCNIRTIISTCIKQGVNYFDYFRNILNNKIIPISKSGLIMMPVNNL